ncbi:hypothetical protein KTJ89_12405 [Brevibacterium sediminis]|uniref:hypothetical protein n=1 Tax=Brevibacterium sediminis TaxID=1857024 RepID=UPI002174FF49|nr:hypothetical protein [Brevibacterium sediminis]MCS4593781.1 hypothetical protein [Brevibacterium sediminis]
MARTHRSEADTRIRVSEAIIDYVAEHGGGVRPEIPMEVILESAQVSRASAYRIWRGKEAFGAFALEQCVSGHAMATLNADRALELARAAESSTPGRLEAAAEFLCSAADEELDILLESDRWRAFVRFQAIAADDPTSEVGTLLAKIESEDIERIARIYETVAAVWGLVPIPEGGTRSIAEAVLLLARSSIGRIVSGRDETSARGIYAEALRGLIRGSFREVPGTRVDLDAARRQWGEGSGEA